MKAGKKEYTFEDLLKVKDDALLMAKDRLTFDRNLFIIELIAALNTTGGDSISREALEKMLQK
jgi:hypothetical protein